MIVADPVAGIVPRLQGNATQAPWDEATVPMVKPSGKLSSVTVTLSASEGPSLVTVMVYS